MLAAAAVKISISKHGLPFGSPSHKNILLNGKPALKIGSKTKIHPPPGKKDPISPDVVIEGVKNVLFNGIPAITIKKKAKHIGAGNTIVQTGFPKILIG